MVAAIALLVCASCGDLTVPNYNNVSVDQLTGTPTRPGVAAAAQGLLRGTRNNVGEMVHWLGAFGREGYQMSSTGASLPGSVRDPLTGSNFPGGNLWADPYRNIRNAEFLLGSIDAVVGLNDLEKEAARGFVKTIQAYDFLQIIVTRDRFGAPIDVGGDPNGDPAPIASKAEVYAHIVKLLNEGQTHLQAAGTTAFPFLVHSGLRDFNTPARFVLLNRGLKARVDVYMDNWEAALTSLEQSFLNVTGPLDAGAYHVYTTNSGDLPNPLFRLDRFYAHSRLRTEAQLRADETRDLRAQNKLNTVTPLTVLGVTSNVQYTTYGGPSARLPWMKNEELILLRAEANLGLNRFVEAAQDINTIRVRSGGLEPIVNLANLGREQILTELLYNKRYSLTWEFGHTWIDMRHYGRLLQIPVGTGDPRLFDAMPFPLSECLPRNPQPIGCEEQAGFRP
jgi:hypothetical protein